MENRTVSTAQGTGEAATTGGLKPNALGVLGILFFVLAAQAPLTGIAGAVPIAAAIGSGPGVPVAYATAGAIILLFSVGFVAMGRRLVNAGAFYVYIGTGLGEKAGIGSAGLATFAYCMIQAAMYGLYGATVQGLVAAYAGVDIPWWVWAVVTMLLVQALSWFGVEIGARVLALLVLLEFAFLVAFALVTLFTGGGPEGLAPAESFSLQAALQGAPGVALMFAFASMFGFEATAIYGEEARDSSRTVPRATYLAVATVTIFFAFTTWMLVSAHGASNAGATALESLETDSTMWVFGPVGDLFGPWVVHVLSIALATSLFAGILAFHNSANRYLFSLSRAGLLPSKLGAVNRRYAPWAAGIVQTVIAFLLVIPFAAAGQDPVLTLFSWFSGTGVLAMMLLYLLTSVSVIVFFRKDKSDTRLWNTVIAPTLGSIGLAAAITLILANFSTLIDGDLWLATVLALTVPLVLALSIGFSQLVSRKEEMKD